MPRKQSPTLTDAELRVMEVLWRLGTGTVSEISEAMLAPALAYNTVLTTLRILEVKGHVGHEQSGRAYIYKAVTARDAAEQSAIKSVVSKFFGNNAGALALRVIENERLSDEELQRLRSLIERYDEES
jgi:BlaI family transcriptional regulator, penicillinase repressor